MMKAELTIKTFLQHHPEHQHSAKKVRVNRVSIIVLDEAGKIAFNKWVKEKVRR